VPLPPTLRAGAGDPNLLPIESIRDPMRLLPASVRIDADPVAPIVTDRRWHLAVVGGLEAGAELDLPFDRLDPPTCTVGRGPGNDVALAHPTVSRRHAVLAIGAAGIEVTDLGARNTTLRAGRPVGSGAPVGPGDVVRIGALAVEVRPGPALLPRRAAPASVDRSARPFNRPPRTTATTGPPPLDQPARESFHPRPGAGLSVTMLLGPLVFGAVLAVLFSPLMAVFALMGPALLLGSWAERRLHDRRARRRSAGRRQLTTAAFALEAARRHHHEQAARRRAQPDPTALRRWVDGGGRLWERRPDHHDAFQLSVGLAHRPWQPWPDEDGSLSPSTATILADLGPLVDTPVVVELGPGRAIGIVGPAPARDAVLRWLVCQLATLHGPADVTLRALPPTGSHPARALVDRLPHGGAHPPAPDDATARSVPLDVVVVPDASADELIEPLARLVNGEQSGRAVLVGADRREQLPSWCTTVVEVVDTDGRAVVHDTRSGTVVADVLATGLTATAADRWAAALARHRDPEVASSSAGLPDSLGTEQLVGPVTVPAIVERWEHARRRPGGVAAPIAVTAAPAGGDPPPLSIDLVADGPHALIGGTTGAGKSELLRTLVLSLALHHPPDAVSFLLVDYKGGSAFDACTDLPHTVGLVTDLDPHLASRALVALDAELRRREHVLRRAGVADLTSGAVPSLARLVVVIDEFATLAAELPGFLDALVDVAQRGRSLGVHLVLATQRPHGAISDRIRTNTNLRIALRMLDRAESTDVVDDPAAARLARDRPGRGYARFGHDELVLFQTALTEPPRLRHLVDQISQAATASGVGRPAAPWLAPLPTSLTLAEFDRFDDPDDDPEVDPSDDAEVDPRVDASGRAGVAVRLALADEPALQRQRPWCWHLERGNLLVYGMPGSGTTTALVSLGLLLAQRADHERFHLHGVADGSGQLRALRDLPSVGTIIEADDVRRQARLVRMLVDELEVRRAGRHDRRPTVVVLLDDLPGLLRRFDTVEGHAVVDGLHHVFRDGPAVGIHLAVTSDRPSAIPSALASRTTERLVLRLADPFDLTTLGLRPSPEAGSTLDRRPGRGVVGQGAGIEVQVAWCPDPAAAIRPLIARQRLAHAGRHDGPSAVGELPTRVEAGDLPPAITDATTAGRTVLHLPLGIGDRDLRPRGFGLEPGQHALIVGPARSGRSTALVVLARAVLAQTVPARAALAAPAAANEEASPGCVIALTPRPSPLRTAPGITTVTDVDRVLAEVARAGEAGTIVVLVDDCELVDDRTGALAALVGSNRPGFHLIAAGRSDRLRMDYGHWSTALRPSGRGLVLRPDLDRDGDPWGVRLPRDPASRQCDGRGFLIVDGGAELLQVATTEPRSTASGDAPPRRAAS